MQDEEWQACLIGFLKQNYDFLLALKKSIRVIEKDDSKEQILEQWEFLRKRFHRPHQFTELIPEVAADMGRENIDSERFCKRFYNEWVKELQLLQGNYEFHVEARKLIEHALLDKTMPVLPITGSDIMREFDIPPGPQVGYILEKARELYVSHPCSRDKLLIRLREESP